MKLYKHHPAAEIFPMPPPEKIAALAASIKKLGQLDTIILHPDNDLVVDGRSRQAACKLLGIEPAYSYWDGEGSLTDWVIAKNLDRRHLSKDEQVAAALAALPLYEAEAEARQKAGGLAPRGAKASELVAEKFGVAPRTLERAKSVSTKAPELAERVRAGELTWKQAEKQHQLEQRKAEVRVFRPATGLFSVILDDPSYPFEDTLSGAGMERALPYPPQTYEQILADKPPAAEDCTLYLCVPNSHLPFAFQAIAHWGFRYTGAMITWDKESIGMGRWLRAQTEQILIAVKGKPLHTCSNQSSLLRARRGANSEKPDELYALIESLSPAEPKLEMYARQERKGWTTVGSEVQAKAKKKNRKLFIPGDAA